MVKYLRVTMPDGSKWDVPAQMIAHDRAKSYADTDAGRPDGEEFDRLYTEELAFTLSSDEEIEDWAANNMNWEDVAPLAVMTAPSVDVDYQEGWVNGDKEVIER